MGRSEFMSNDKVHFHHSPPLKLDLVSSHIVPHAEFGKPECLKTLIRTMNCKNN